MLFPDCAESNHDFLFATQLSPSNLKEWQADDSPNIPKVYFPCHKHLFINKFHKSRIIYDICFDKHISHFLHSRQLHERVFSFLHCCC